eukprot:4053305-Pyramimonas_sp.AAC.1
MRILSRICWGARGSAGSWARSPRALGPSLVASPPSLAAPSWWRPGRYWAPGSRRLEASAIRTRQPKHPSA